MDNSRLILEMASAIGKQFEELWQFGFHWPRIIHSQGPPAMVVSCQDLILG